jgi:Hemolysins and related proteins containing CBS domains
MNVLPFIADAIEAFGTPARSWDGPVAISLKLLAVILLVLLNGFFVASEFAIVKVRSSQLDALVAQGSGRARLARHVTTHLDAYLSATQLGITLASLGLGWLGEPFLAQMIEPFFALANVTSPQLIDTISFALAFVTITVLHIVLGELAPKSLAINKALPTTLWISRPLRLFYFVFQPAVWLLNGLANWLLKRVFHLEPVAGTELVHSEEELKVILDESASSSQISKTSHQIVANAFELRHRLVREVMTPRGEVIYLDSTVPFRENLRRAISAPHTHFPLCVEHFDRPIGLIHVKDLLSELDKPKPSLMAVKRELVAVPEATSLEKLLTCLRDRQAHLAVVVDEFGGNVGIVTIQRAIVEVIGRLPGQSGLGSDEFRRIGEDEFVVDARVATHELRDLVGLEWKDNDVTTIGGYVVHQIGHLPCAGEKVYIDGYIVTVEKADSRRVRELRFQRSADGDTFT